MDRFKLLAFATVIVVAGLAAMMWAGMSVVDRAGGMAAAGTSANAFQAAVSGTPVKLVVSVDRVAPNGGITAEILNKSTDGTYAHSGRHLEAALPANAKFLMGGQDDLKPGAIVQINGKIAAAHRLAVDEVVILNGFVRMVR